MTSLASFGGIIVTFVKDLVEELDISQKLLFVGAKNSLSPTLRHWSMSSDSGLTEVRSPGVYVAAEVTAAESEEGRENLFKLTPSECEVSVVILEEVLLSVGELLLAEEQGSEVVLAKVSSFLVS